MKGALRGVRWFAVRRCAVVRSGVRWCAGVRRGAPWRAVGCAVVRDLTSANSHAPLLGCSSRCSCTSTTSHLHRIALRTCASARAARRAPCWLGLLGDPSSCHRNPHTLTSPALSSPVLSSPTLTHPNPPMTLPQASPQPLALPQRPPALRTSLASLSPCAPWKEKAFSSNST
eukprot:7379040-Prymnesium_polylepis.3